MVEKNSEKSYSEAMDRLDEILSQMETSEQVDVDHLAERVEEASGLIRLCREKLRRTELSVNRIVDELEEEDPGGNPGPPVP